MTKFSADGKYLPFHGYTVASMVMTDLSHIEVFIKNTKLSKYFSALPSRSYHMTIYNIWCHGQRLLPFQKEWLELEFDKRVQVNKKSALKWKKEFLSDVKGPKSIGWDWPDELMNDKMLRAYRNCTDLFGNEKIEFKVEGNICVHGTLMISITHTEKEQELTKLRSTFSELFGRPDDNLRYHITLAYRYKNIPDEDLEECKQLCEKLSEMVNAIPINLRTPLPRWFDSMENYYHWYDLNPTNNIYYADL